MIPKALREEVDARRQLAETCALCGRDLNEGGPFIFHSQNHPEPTRYQHVGCVDWSERESPYRDLIRRIRSSRRKAGELEHVLMIAEKLAESRDRAWNERPQIRRKLALYYFRLLERIQKVVWDAFGGW